MTPDQGELLAEARDSLLAARLLLANRFPGYAASRAYYAMFYAAQALLEGEGLSFSSHSAVISAFGQHFARTGRIPAAQHKALIDAQALRHTGDYGQRGAVTSVQAQAQIDQAEAFLNTAEQLAGSPGLQTT